MDLYIETEMVVTPKGTLTVDWRVMKRVKQRNVADEVVFLGTASNEGYALSEARRRAKNLLVAEAYGKKEHEVA